MLLMLVFAGCATSDDFEVNRKNCERYRDRLIDLRFNESNPAADMRPHRAAMKNVLNDRFVASCEQQLSSEQLKCALRAGDLASATACTKSDSK